MNRKGFTLIELILVIAILGILAVSALPKFLDLTETAEEASRDGVVGAVRSGLQLYYANTIVDDTVADGYPAALDTNGNGAACTTCFGTLLSNAISDSSWTKNSDTSYTFNDGANTFNYTYNVTNGTFQ